MTTGRINQVNEAFSRIMPRCHETRSCDGGKHLLRDNFSGKKNSQIRSTFNSVPMTAELTSSEQHFTKRILHQWDKQFSNTILWKRTTHPNISAELNQTIHQKNCPAESGDNWTEYCWMPKEERQIFFKKKNHLAPSRTQSAAQKCGWPHCCARTLLQNPTQPYLDRIHTRGGICQPF